MKSLRLKIAFRFIALLIFIFTSINLFSQEKKYKMACIGFYNVENLYDTIDTPGKNDEEFTPEGINKWTGDRYKKKIIALSEVISQLGNDYIKGGPAIMGFSEIENLQVLEDLINAPLLKPMNYGIVHYESPDVRGVDVALIYQKSLFTVTKSKSYTLTIPEDTSFRTREQLVVSGMFDGEPLHIIVNHWPSRRGGEKRSAPKRFAASQLCRAITDSIIKSEANAKIIIMGDFNDDPVDKSITSGLKAKSEQNQTNAGELFNPMYKLYKKDGIGSLAYRDKWNLFDQIIVSYPLLGDASVSYKFFKAYIYNKPFLMQKESAFKGYPWRTYAGGVYLGGYSDHFPAYIFLIKESK